MMASRVKERSATAKASAMSKFSRQLRGWREKKGWSQIELAQQLGFSNSLISHLEHQEKQPSADFAEKCDQVFDLPGTFADLQELVAREAWPSYFAPVVDFRTRAIRMHDWDLRILPGFLQIQDYARSVITAGLPYLANDQVERKVAARMDLQQVLQREVGRPQLWEVVHEGVLRHVIGSPEIMQAQLDHLIEAADSPDIVLQVLPFTAHDHPGAGGPISLFDFADAPTVGYTECNDGGMIVEQPDQVAGLVTTMNLIRAAALPPRDSLNLLRTIRDEIA
jgi:transcriptional regulator with XRE-family HTH domain